MHDLTRWLGMVALACAAGCGTSTTSGSDMGTGGADMTQVCASDNMPVALAKHYGVKVSLNVNVKVPSDCMGDSCILDKDAASQLLMLADITQTGAGLTMTAHPCHIVIPPVALKGQPMPTVLTASDMLAQAVKPVTVMAMLDGANTCSNFALPPIPILIGARLANPASDALPVFNIANGVTLCGGKASTTCDAAMDTGCVCDQDADGKLGATVAASGVPALDDVDKLYLVLRTVVSLKAQVYPSGAGQATAGQRFKGAVSSLTLEQSPVGCHHTPAGGGAPYDCTPSEVNSAAQLNPRIAQSANLPSSFIAMPVADSETCDQLAADAPTLFKNQ